MDKLTLNLAELKVEAFQTSGTEGKEFVETRPILACTAGSCGHICP